MHEDREWIEYKKRFVSLYDPVNNARSLQGRLMHISHELLERRFDQDLHYDKVLEIGAGTGEHLPYVRHQFNSYILSDHDPEVLNITKTRYANNRHNKLQFEIQSGSELSYANESFDRVIATHVLEHIYQPHLAIKEWNRVLKQTGVISILLPTDPGLAWRLGKYLGPRRKAVAKGIAYDYVMAREHVNSCINLLHLLRHYFSNSFEYWWPTRIRSTDLNLFLAFHATK